MRGAAGLMLIRTQLFYAPANLLVAGAGLLYRHGLYGRLGGGVLIVHDVVVAHPVPLVRHSKRHFSGLFFIGIAVAVVAALRGAVGTGIANNGAAQGVSR